MTDTPDDIQRKIADLEALRPSIGDAAVDAAVAALRAQLKTAKNVTGNVNVGSNNYGQNIGVNLGIAIFGHQPPYREQERIVRYLDVLATTLYRLPLRGIATKLEREGEGVALPAVYTLLATKQQEMVLSDTYHNLHHFFEDELPSTGGISPLKKQYAPDYALPDQALDVQVDTITNDQEPVTFIYLSRARLVTEAVRRARRLVLLGEPGSGKSTFARYLCWVLAQRELENLPAATAVPFKDWNKSYLPIMVSLRALAGQLAVDGANTNTVQAAVQVAMQQIKVQPVAEMLDEALHKGVALICFDGLDEVPTYATADAVSRETTLQTLKAFGEHYPDTTILVTCRVRAFSEHLRQTLGWEVETLAPFTLGQIRHFITAWYQELVVKGQLTEAQASNYEQGLIASLTTNRSDAPKLRGMAETPLLLTLMAWVLCDSGHLPRDRPELYEKILNLLLEQWDAVREQRSLVDIIGAAGWNSKRMLPLLDRLSYEAHRDSVSADGRGRLSAIRLQKALQDHLTDGGMQDDLAAAAAVRCLQHFDYRSGLLRPDADDYVFAHLTLQEHCAGRHMVLGSADPVALVMEHRNNDRWHEPIFLGLGLAPPADLDDVFDALLSEQEYQHATLKPLVQQYRDLILAAEIGADRDWNYLRIQPRIKVSRLQPALRTGLNTLLNDREQPLTVHERVRAAILLSDLGDWRSPITIEEWKIEAEKALVSNSSHYFCKVEPGTYYIGSSDSDSDAYPNENPQHTATFDHPFWIARLPITNKQWQIWVKAGGNQSRFATDGNLNHPNQPVVGVQWYWCRDFCKWLSKQTGQIIRLPSEAEWEAAARGGDTRRYPWGNEWRHNHAVTKENQDARQQWQSVPVGCYAAGAAPCGALDLAGNVWEWTYTPWTNNHELAQTMQMIDDATIFTLKGGCYGSSQRSTRCGTRNWSVPNSYGMMYISGFRVILAPAE
jgi:formylglycine-generating enzyme required for sulfatase activity